MIDFKSAKTEHGWIAEPALFANVLKPRPRNFHKGMAGSLGIIGGAAGMAGAALLAGRAALKLGAGRVYVGLLEPLAVDPDAPELMLRHPDDVLGLDLDAIVIGPGLGQGERAETLLGAVLASDIPCVLDADALNLIAENEDLRKACARRTRRHAAHAASGRSGAAARRNHRAACRPTASRQRAPCRPTSTRTSSSRATAASSWRATATGSSTPPAIPAWPRPAWATCWPESSARCSRRNTRGETALVLGTHLHGCAADECVSAGAGPVGLTASELIDPARRLWNSWLFVLTPIDAFRSLT